MSVLIASVLMFVLGYVTAYTFTEGELEKVLKDRLSKGKKISIVIDGEGYLYEKLGNSVKIRPISVDFNTEE